MEKFICSITDYFLNNEIVEKEKIPLTKYLLQIWIEKILVCITLIVICAFEGVLLELIIFLAAYAGIRKYAGGYHANTFWKCYIGSIVLIVSTLELILPLCIRYMGVTVILFVLSVVVIVIIGNVNHPNMNYTVFESRETRRCAREMVALETACILSVAILGVESRYFISACLGVIICAILMIIAKAIRQEV